jgi:two-component system, NarL family, sensor kinase
MRRDQHPLRLIQGSNRQVSEAPCAKVLPSGCSEPSKDLTHALQSSEQRLCALLDDRGRLGRDLHDCVLQSLYAIGLSLEHSHRLASPVRHKHRSSGADVVNQLNALIQDIRRMITELEHGTVATFDLSSELRGLVQTYAQVSPVCITLKLQPSTLEILTGEEEREILHIVREALSNCVRHAKASRASVALRMRGSRVRLVIEDNGMGFDPDKKRGAGYGLANMAARAKRLGGQVTIRAQSRGGTKVVTEFVVEPILQPV